MVVAVTTLVNISICIIVCIYYKTSIFTRRCGLRIRFFTSIKKRKLGFCFHRFISVCYLLYWLEFKQLKVLHKLNTGL
ncbi:hypothetical protein L6452_40583 [Arctium lappa]|uniref:Uncharacterized protein n=1 Tax=Arctium lappa TaxID=4217 RepID=A0ACB8XNG3_ARCLA|nr:hypothetical protein L6452_40583 [Arctium lappa]